MTRGPRVAVVGGGQLARMLQQAAVGLNVRLRVLVEAPDSSAAQVVPDAPVGLPRDLAAVRRLVQEADVLTFEHEHVPQPVLRALEAGGVAIRPGPAALAHAQDKIAMRRHLTDLGVPCPEWAEVTSTGELAEFGARVGWPVVVKRAVGGYDGKGVRVVREPGEAADWLHDDGVGVLAEAYVPFARELAVLVARRPSGELRAWPVVETVQRGGICAEVVAPAPGLAPTLAEQAQAVGVAVAEGLGVTGVLAVEMFEEPAHDGGPARVLVNELAMRPHNSGHWTIDGAVTSQFEQHLRAVLDLPLGETTPVAPWSVMVNLLGSDLPDPTRAYPAVFAQCPRARVHLYGKEVRPGRKLGHVTVCGSDLDAAREEAARAVALLGGRREELGGR